MDASLGIVGLTVRYGNKRETTTAIDNVDLSLASGELVSLIGPSGCGKSTLLRTIAGLQAQTSGRIKIGGRDVAPLRPSQRRVAFVFQSYALYPQMTVAQNLAAPLNMTELSALGRAPVLWRVSRQQGNVRASIATRVAAMAETLELGPYLDRRPAALSGGQQQRVALGRALIRDQALFLLDEPLANLDASLRQSTRSEIRTLQRRLGATTLFVTHDQAEAMAISDRVAVMFDGVIHQIGTPDSLYRKPTTLRVARFLCQPLLNELPVDLVQKSIGTSNKTGDILVAGQPLDALAGIVAVRPEHSELRDAARPGLPGIAVTVDEVEHGGSASHVFVRTRQNQRLGVRVSAEKLTHWPRGKQAVFGFELDMAHVFADETTADVAQAAA
ncbi:MAG: ABC transporter ATP-binding protein [Paracoccaceae bacterium]